MALSEKLIDKRILRRSLEKGEVSENDFQDYLKGLPDTAGNLEPSGQGDNTATAPETPAPTEG